MLSQSRNLDYYNSDHLVISESMETPQVRRSMYPDIEPYDTGFLKVSDVHTVYYEQSGNPDGHVSFLLPLHDVYWLSILHRNYYKIYVFFMKCMCIIYS